MLHNLAFAIWFLLPAAIANAAPIFVAVLPGLRQWDTPIDMNRTLNDKPIFGSHKTWRGLLTAIVAGAAVFALQQYLVHHNQVVHNFVGHTTYAQLPIYMGALMGFGAIAGDAIESFAKRQLGHRPGKSLLFFDQVDYIIGGVLVTLPFIQLATQEYLYIFVVWFTLHLAASYGGYKIGLKDEPI
jgi:CDP-2,3-bis-(O-geranylgeranyl)-sn-glycerol synthase